MRSTVLCMCPKVILAAMLNCGILRWNRELYHRTGHFCSFQEPWLFSTTLRTTHAKVSGPRLPCDKYFRLWTCWHANISHQYNGAADTGRTKCEDVKGPSLRVETDKKNNDMKRSRWIATCHFQRLAWSDRCLQTTSPILLLGRKKSRRKLDASGYVLWVWGLRCMFVCLVCPLCLPLPAVDWE